MSKRILGSVCEAALGIARMIAALWKAWYPVLSGPAKYGLGIALLAYVIWSNWYPPANSPPGARGLVDVWNGALPIQWLPALTASLIGLVAILLTFVRWYILVRAQDLPFTLLNACRLGLIGFFLSTFLPGSIGGDVIKATFLAREQSRRTVAVATVLIDRVVGLWGLTWLVALLGSCFWILGNPAILANNYLKGIVIIVDLIMAATVACWFLLGILSSKRAEVFADWLARLPKVGHTAAEFWRAFWLYRRRRGQLAAALLLAMIGHVGFVLTFYFSAQIFLSPGGQDQIPTLAEQFLIVPIGMTFQAVFLTPGGVGGAEWAFGKLFAQVGKNPTYGVLGCLGQRIINYALGFIGYLVYLRMRPAIRAVNTKSAEVLAA